MTLVKICGIRSLMSAQTALYSGAKFLGFNFVPGSRRKISPVFAKQIIDEIKGQVKTVGVFQNQSIEEVNRVAEFLDLDFVQLHGDEDSTYIEEIKKPVIKTLQLNPDFDITNTLKKMNKYRQSFSANRQSFSANESTHDLTVGVSSLDRTASDLGKPSTSQSGFYRDKVDYFLLDRKKQGQGKMLNLKKLNIISKSHQIFVAGGLNPDNVQEVLKSVNPYGVDAASGIETNMVEDLEKIKLFTERVKNV